MVPSGIDRIVRALVVLVVLAGVLLWACIDNPVPTSIDLEDSRPLTEIVDAAHGDGNPHFFFLPPVAPALVADGVFDGSLAPSVTICEWKGSACSLPVLVEFTATSRRSSENVRVVPEDELYIVDWDTKRFTLRQGRTYRIKVFVAGTELGHADVQVEGRGKKLRNVDTNQFVVLTDGSTLPIKFRIEEGAVEVLGTSGGSFTALDGRVTFDVPAGSLSQPVGITVVQAPDDASATFMIPGAIIDFGPDGTSFDPPATVTISYDENLLPAGVAEEDLRLYKRVNGVWTLVPGSTVDVDANTVTGPAVGFSDFGPGAALNLSFTESVSLSDQVSVAPALVLSFTETIQEVDQASVLPSLLLSFTESVQLLDQAAAEVTLPKWTDPNGVDHWYEVIPAGSPSINWTDARDAAAARSYKGHQGHLVTILFEDEQLFLQQNLDLSKNSWIGVADEDHDGVYTWVTGEAAWNRNAPSPTCLLSYCNWLANEPNNNGGVEWYGEMWSGPNYVWNDITNDDADIGQEGRIGIYIVEYDGQ